MYEKLKEGADIVVGTRRTNPKEWGLLRVIISETVNIMGRIRLLLSGCYTQDPVSDFFAGKTSIFQNIIKTNNKRFVKKGFKVLMDLLKVLPEDTKIETVYYTFMLREAGESIGLRHIIFYLKSLIS